MGSKTDGLFEVFAEKTQAAGMEVYRAASRTAARELRGDIIRELGGVRVAVAPSPLKLPEVSAAVMRRRKNAVQAAGAPLVAPDCPGCALQVKGALDFHGVGVEAPYGRNPGRTPPWSAV